jgi:hypothetical protein
MADLTSLIERIEAATGGDRELDAEIWLACTPGATRDKWSYIHKATGRECTVDETRNATGRLIIVPEYTTSIDAALTLVPEGRAIRREYLPAATWPHRVWIYKDSFMPLDDGSRRPVLGKTEALALCAAALKARAETESPHEHD